MKRRFRCEKCGRVGAYGSFERRRTFKAPGWMKRLLQHGLGNCLNVVACFARKRRKDERRARREREARERMVAA